MRTLPVSLTAPLVVALLWLGSACSRSPEGPPAGGSTVFGRGVPETAPSIRGTIVSIDEIGRVRVEAPLSAESQYDKAVVNLRGARLLWRSGTPARLQDFSVGREVSVWFVGAVLESYPVQVGAGVAVIEPGGR